MSKEQRLVPVGPASPDSAKQGWRLDYNTLDRIARESFKRTGYYTTMETVEDILLHAMLSAAPVPAAMEWREAMFEERARYHDEQERRFRARALEAYSSPGRLTDVGDAKDQIADLHRDSAKAIRALSSLPAGGLNHRTDPSDGGPNGHPGTESALRSFSEGEK